MEIVNQVGSSTIILTDDALTLTISRSFFTLRQWQGLVGLLTDLIAAGLAWVLAPVRLAPSSDEGTRPRWRQVSLDWLSILLFQLLIPSEHPLRRLFTTLEWHTIDERCAPAYHNGGRGAPAYPPQLLFRILVLMFYSGTPFESATFLRLQTDLAWRWFVGLSVLQPIPNVSTLSYFRKRLGVALFETILADVILACDAAGLIGQVEAYFDMTGIEASATQVTPYQRAVILAKALSAYLEIAPASGEAFSQEQLAALALEALQEMHPSLEKVSPEQIVASQTHLDAELASTVTGETKWWQRLRAQLPSLLLPPDPPAALTPAVLRRLAGQCVPLLPQAFGNPDAAVGHTRTDGTLCGYRGGLLTDAQHWIITAVVFEPLNQPEAPAVLTALKAHQDLFRRLPERIGLDSAFDRDPVHQYLEAHGIFGGITVRSRPGAAGVFHADAFVWNADGQLVCPHDHVMQPVAGPDKNGLDRYRAPEGCAQCPLLNQCLTPKQQARGDSPCRELQTHTAAHQRAQRNRERSRSRAGRALRRRRFASEGLFGHLNRFHHGDKSPYRDDDMDHIGLLMVAVVSNLEKLATYARR
jgi:transposase